MCFFTRLEAELVVILVLLDDVEEVDLHGCTPGRERARAMGDKVGTFAG